MSRRIAIIEDDPAIRANYADVLRRQGYEVAVHPDRTSAMQAFRTRLPDLAILDIGLGDEIDGGFALCRERVVDFYDRGGDEDAQKSPLIFELGLSKDEKSDLVAFLGSLTGRLPVVSPDSAGTQASEIILPR